MNCARSPLSVATQHTPNAHLSRDILARGMGSLAQPYADLQDPIQVTANTFRASDGLDLTHAIVDLTDTPLDLTGEEIFILDGTALQPAVRPPGPRTFYVTGLSDSVNPFDGEITLREAILEANANPGADTIRFFPNVAGTITLTQGELHIADDLTIEGVGANNLTISGNHTSRVLQIGSAILNNTLTLSITNAPTVSLSGLTIADGSSNDQGGGILNWGNLTVTNSIFRNNASSYQGGAIFNRGNLAIAKSTFTQNSASFGGGAIANEGQAQISSSTFNYNSTPQGLGGAIFNSHNMTISGSTLVDNTATTNGGGIYSAPGFGVSTILSHTTIARNTTGLNTPDIAGSNVTSLGGNRIGVNTVTNLRAQTGDFFGTVTNPVQPLFNLRVDTLVDEMDNNFAAGDLSLREALAIISSGGTITFAPELVGTIALTMGELDIMKNVTIDGPAAAALTISGERRSRVFDISSNVMVQIDGLTIANGWSDNSGGGMRMTVGSEVTLNGVMIRDNTAGNFTGGGGIWNDRGELTITNSTFSRNYAGFGGAIMNGHTGYPSDRSSTVDITNSTFNGNQAFLGGAIFNQVGTLNLTSSTISGNAGVGVVNTDRATVRNTIIAGNTAHTGNNPDVSGTFTSWGYNLIGNGTGSTGFSQIGDQVGTTEAPINPRLGALHDNGGTTWTMELLAGSPAQNAGDPMLIAGTDQRGVSRSWHGRPDIGAFERPNTPPTATNDRYSVRNGRITFNPLTNDLDGDGDRLSIVDYSQPNNGFLTRNGDGSFTYQADRSSRWWDSFTYTITDGQGGFSTATVRFELVPNWF